MINRRRRLRKGAVRAKFTELKTAANFKGFFPARDGTSLYYEVRGEGRPLVFCYGLMCQREHWRHQIKYFSPRYRVITFDYRGHQCSPSPRNDRNMTLKWCAQDLQDLFNHLEMEETVILGHSMGVPVIAELVPMEQKRVKGAVMVCGCVTNPFQKMFYSNRMDLVFRSFAKLYDWAPEITTTIWNRFTQNNRFSYFLTANLGFNPERAEEQDVKMYMRGVMETPLQTFQSLLRDYMDYDGRPKLKDIPCPTLVIAGEEDCITPLDTQEEMVSLLPQGRLETIPEGSHNAHMDDPAAVNKLIEDFLNEMNYR